MKYFLLLGGFLGFLFTWAASCYAGNGAEYALRDGMIGCFGSALLWRGLHAVVVASFSSQLNSNRSSAAAAVAGDEAR